MIQVFQLPGSIGVTCLVALVTGLIVNWLVKRWRYKFPPGPPGLPLLGNTLQIESNRLHEQALEWSNTYGPVVTVNIGTIPLVFVNTIETAMEVLVKKSTDFAARMVTPSMGVFTYGGKDIAFSSYGPTWKLHRKIASKALRHYLQGDALQRRINDAVGTAFDEIDKVSGHFDPSDYINFLAANIMTGLCFGGQYEFKDEELTNILQLDDEILGFLGVGTMEDYIPGLKHVYKTARFKQIEMLTEKIVGGFVTKKFKEAESTFEKGNIRHFTDNLILARMEAEEEEGVEAVSGLDEDHLVQTLSDIFFAGIDPTRFTLRYALLHMVAFPDIQEKVQKEIDSVVGKDRLPGIRDRPNLGYTEAVLHESMRLASIAPTGVFHMTSRDTDVAGYRIPKGTNVVINHWGLHHDPSAWDDVDRFIPERYLDSDGKLGPKPKNWLPFSAGTRVCLGEFVSKSELHLIFASLMQRYKWKMESGLCPDMTPVGTMLALECKPYKVMVAKRI